MFDIGTFAVSERVASAPEPSAAPLLGAPLEQPLVLDLDHTLIRTDLLFECFAAALFKNPLVLFQAIFWLPRGKAFLKRQLAAVGAPDFDVLPVNADVVSLAEREAAAGRRIVLATAADELIAWRIARRFPFISEVIASDGALNLKGEAKARALARRYPSGFVYAGDSMADVAVWRTASLAITVGATRRIATNVAVSGTPALALSRRASEAITLVEALRLKQWAKNALVFAPVPLSGQFANPSAWAMAFAAFLALGLIASATYLVNDLVDLNHDRRHWSKKQRPLASGALGIDSALMLMAALFLAGSALAAAAGWRIAAVVAVYALMTLAYSLSLKRIPILDVATLAALFTLRLFLGVVAIGAVISPWLFIFSMALFLSLSIAKRHTEVVRMALHGQTSAQGRGYVARDEPLLLAMGLGAAAAAIVLFSLYLTAEVTHVGVYTAPAFLWMTPVALFLWLGRVWLLSQRGELDDDPVVFALRDGASLGLGAAVAASFALAVFAEVLA